MGERVKGREGSDPRHVGDGSAEATQHRRSHQEQMDRCKSIYFIRRNQSEGLVHK